MEGTKNQIRSNNAPKRKSLSRWKPNHPTSCAFLLAPFLPLQYTVCTSDVIVADVNARHRGVCEVSELRLCALLPSSLHVGYYDSRRTYARFTQKGERSSNFSGATDWQVPPPSSQWSCPKRSTTQPLGSSISIKIHLPPIHVAKVLEQLSSKRKLERLLIAK